MIYIKNPIEIIIVYIICLILSYFVDNRIKSSYNKVNLKKYTTIAIYFIILISDNLLYAKYGMEPKTFRYMLLIAIMVELSVIDCYTQNVYDIDVLSGILLEGILLFITTKIGYQISVTDHLVGLLVGFSVPYLIAVLTKSLGLGDVGVYSLCSLTLGLNYSIYLIGLSFVLAGIFTISASAMRGRLLRGAIPFVPFISVATFLIMMSEFKLLNIYIYTVKSLI